MKRLPKLRPNGWDLLVLAAVLLLTAGSALTVWKGMEETGRLQAVISVDGTETESVDLSRLKGEEERTIEANGYTLQLVMTPTGVCVAQSDCPTQDCVHTGEITRPGQSIVCLPARVSVQLRGAAQDPGVDAVIG